MKRMRVAVVVAVALSAVAALAGGLTKYRGWDKTPEGYFMTPSERSDWRKVQTDDDAEKFVTAYEARRGEQFKADVADAATAADKYFTLGKIKGSATERGKVIIVLGPPQGVSLAKRKTANDARMAPTGINGESGGASASGGASVADMMSAANGPSGGGFVNEYTITYSKDQLPAAYGKDLTVKIDVNSDGTDYVADRKSQGELDRLYDMVAQTKASAPAVPPAH